MRPQVWGSPDPLRLLTSPLLKPVDKTWRTRLFQQLGRQQRVFQEHKAAASTAAPRRGRTAPRSVSCPGENGQ